MKVCHAHMWILKSSYPCIYKRTFFLIMIISTFTLFLCLFNFCSSSVVTTEAQESIPMYSREYGPSCETFHRFTAALVSAVYSIPSVQKAFYEEFRKITPASSHSDLEKHYVKLLVGKFVKMRLDDAEVALRENAGGIFQPVDALWTQILLKLPKSIQNLFLFKLRVEVIRHTDPIAIHHGVEYRNTKSVMIGSNFKTIHQVVMGHFSDEITNKKAQEKLNVGYRVEVSNKIESHPEVLTLRLNRIVVANQEGPVVFDSSPIYIDKNVIVNQVLYTLAARIELDTETKFYSTVVRDFGDMKSYRYDGSGNVLIEEEDTNGIDDLKSILLFYVPKSSIDFIDLKKLRSNRDIPSVLVDSLSQVSGSKRSHDEIATGAGELSTAVITEKPVITIDLTSDEPELQAKATNISSDPKVEEIWSRIYKPDYNAFPQFRDSFKLIEDALKSRIGIWPEEFINLQAKATYKFYILGSEPYSFKPGPNGLPHEALEIILTALSSNSKIILGLFELYERGTSNLGDKLVIVLVKMLLGCKNISLVELSRTLEIPSGTRLCMPSLKIVTRKIIRAINPLLIHFPTANTVIYENRDSDDPIEVTSQKPVIIIKPRDLLPLRGAHIKGVWFDSSDDSSHRKRTILKSHSEMFVVEVERWPKIGRRTYFDGHDLKFSGGGDYYCSGVVTYGQSSTNFDSFFVDNFSRNSKFRNLIPGQESKSFQFTEETKAHFEKCVEKESVLLFFSKKVSNPAEREIILSKKISKKLLKAVISDYAQDLNFQINENK